MIKRFVSIEVFLKILLTDYLFIEPCQGLKP